MFRTFFLLVLMAGLNEYDANAQTVPQKKLVWSDEFNYAGLPDNTKWAYDIGGDGWGNNELEYYTKADTANARVAGGLLYITARKSSMGGRNYTSARLVTRGKAEWTYGKIEIRARLPKGRGLWPAIWMLGSNCGKVDWPECGEIDIMEHVGYEKDTILGTVHTGKYNHTIGTQKGKKVFINRPYEDFHLYSIDWSSEKIDFLLDDKVYYSVINEHKTRSEWPFDQPFHLLLNIAIGGGLGGKFGVDDTIFPASMEIDYVRVYQ